MDFNSIILILLGSTFGLILRIFIQKNLDLNNFSHHTNEIILSSNTYLYSFPEINSRELSIIDKGTTLLILRNWKVCENEIWVRVELASNKFLDDPNRILKGWIKM